jgi:hypothetical protein
LILYANYRKVLWLTEAIPNFFPTTKIAKDPILGSLWSHKTEGNFRNSSDTALQALLVQ